jgi:hypothetical protein
MFCVFVGWKPNPKTLSKDTPTKPKGAKTPKNRDKEKEKKDSGAPAKESNKDDSFREFRRLCATLSDTDSYTGKTTHVKEFFTKGANGCEYRNRYFGQQHVCLLSTPRDGLDTSALYQGGPGFKISACRRIFLRIAAFLCVTPCSPANNCQPFFGRGERGNLLTEFSVAKFLLEVLQKLSCVRL